SMRARLHAMAALQAEERTKGWSIIATEKRLSLNDPQPMAIGPLTLTGTIDRIEVNEAEGLLRILDYKTFGTAKKPRETHWRAPRESEPVEAAIFNVGDKEQAWSDLQLPLYRHMVPHLWPEHADKRIEVGYFLLPADPEETKIEPLALDDTLQKSAVACAEEIAQRVANGRFWPPATEVGYDSFGDWFGDESPDSCLCDASIQLLGGER
ncbi:MAG: PD-(D/E)XK nuclease family protein, partial [Verrucomicrobia bacterium]|nr:PD-(D/E)XK nuclease family protein [Verrucomicrobiota bacterium]